MNLIVAILGFIVGSAIFLVWGSMRRRENVVDQEAARAQAEETVREAQTRSELIIKEAEVKAKDLVVGARADAEREVRDRRREMQQAESKLESREEAFEKRRSELESAVAGVSADHVAVVITER